MINRREFLHNLAVLAGGALVAAPSVRAQSRPVRIGVLAPSHCALPILLAKIEKENKGTLCCEFDYVVSLNNKRTLNTQPWLIPREESGTGTI